MVFLCQPKCRNESTKHIILLLLLLYRYIIHRRSIFFFFSFSDPFDYFFFWQPDFLYFVLTLSRCTYIQKTIYSFLLFKIIIILLIGNTMWCVEYWVTKNNVQYYTHTFIFFLLFIFFCITIYPIAHIIIICISAKLKSRLLLFVFSIFLFFLSIFPHDYDNST